MNDKLRSVLPVLVVAVWLAFLGAAIWNHAAHSQQPPIYDAIGYFQKAHGLWPKIGLGRPFNPFAVEPAYCPPGTIVMSYPFGFDPDFRGL